MRGLTCRHDAAYLAGEIDTLGALKQAPKISRSARVQPQRHRDGGCVELGHRRDDVAADAYLQRTPLRCTEPRESLGNRSISDTSAAVPAS